MIRLDKINEVKKYKDSNGSIDSIHVTLMDDEILFVPIANDNVDYQTILAWVDAGNKIADAD